MRRRAGNVQAVDVRRVDASEDQHYRLGVRLLCVFPLFSRRFVFREIVTLLIPTFFAVGDYELGEEEIRDGRPASRAL